ncbi:MAG: hypothetical protein N5P05_003514 [Chroococcopsis gigantea SAG 12.99]|jgi:cytoskeletal protein RodZ|nr:DUF4115 domain-containing protein [Chlorogloea purpurea SAG 13.99]MDV3001908.1 hypothetical protein [Chroococcopsis gigantea SAG 12.99]
MFRKKKPVAPQQLQQEILQELGSRLLEIRTGKEISQEQISRQTLIPLRLVKAIESGRMEELPEPIYIRWLIKQYADVLGLDGGKFSSQFPTEKFVSQNKNNFLVRWPVLQLRPIHLYFLYILLVAFSIQFLSNALQKSTLEVNNLPPINLPKSSTVNHPTKIAKPVNDIPVSSQESKQVVVDIKVKDDCWLKVVVDGKTDFEGVLPQGTRRSWQADKEVTVRAGNAGGIYVAVNRAKAKQLGEPGKVEEVTYTAN